MKKWQPCILLLSMFFLVTFLLPVTPFVSAQEKPIELKLAHMFPVNSPSDLHVKAWADKIASDSNGRLTIRIFPVGTLVPPPELYDAAAKGTADLAFGFRYGPKNQPIGVTFPFILGAPDTMTASRIYDDIWKAFPKEMSAEWSDVRILWITPAMVQWMETIPPVRSVADMKGLQIRVPSKEAADFIKDMGGTPVFMSSADMAMALEKGTVDGVISMPAAVEDNKLGTNLRYAINFEIGVPTPIYCTMNKDSYADLPDDLKKVIDDSCEWGKQGNLKYWSAALDTALEYFKEAGVEVINLSPQEKEKWTTILAKARDRVGKQLDEKGFPGTKIVQFIREKEKQYAQ